MIRASDKADLPIKNDSIILDVAEYLEKESSPYQTAAYYYVGRYYSDNGDAVKALRGFQQALSCSEKAGEKNTVCLYTAKWGICLQTNICTIRQRKCASCI